MEVEDTSYVLEIVIISLVFGVLLRSVASAYRKLIMKPKRERWMLKKQGIDGPPPMFLLGNLLDMKKAMNTSATTAATSTSTDTIHCHDCSPSIFPFLHQWTMKYGKVFAFSLGVKTVLHVSEPSLLKDIATNKTLDLGRPSLLEQELGPLLGQGIISSNGAKWANQRKLLSPILYLDKVKGMMNMITDSSITLTDSWMDKINIAGGAIDINVDPALRIFSGDVISKACFGSNYSDSEEIFLKIRRLEVVTSNMFVAIGIPGLRYLPTKKNMEAWALEKEVHKLIMEIVTRGKKMGDETNCGLLQTVLKSAEDSGINKDELIKFIVDNCKNMYLGGYGTTAVTASWCLMLLASHPEWQVRVRNEVVQVCKGQIPTANMLLQMKDLTMVIYETLRLYSPAPVMGREVQNDMRIGDIDMIKGMQIWSYVFPLHTDPENWGADSLEFNPQRFANGVTGACKYPQLYMPFGVGPRICLGQHLALTELKAILSSIVAKFQFSLSPKYAHSPTYTQVLLPKFGVNLVLNKL